MAMAMAWPLGLFCSFSALPHIKRSAVKRGDNASPLIRQLIH
jgi:hypothetical protein